MRTTKDLKKSYKVFYVVACKFLYNTFIMKKVKV